MNDDKANEWIAWLQKAATVRTPVGSAYAIALALMHVAEQLEKIAERDNEPYTRSAKK
jgi:hypothetical protein